MSVDAMKAVWHKSRQTGTALLMLLAIADHANADGLCWPSIKRLAMMARVSERQARRLVAKLVKDGEIEVIEIGGGRGIKTLYRVTLVRNSDADVTVSDENNVVDDTVSRQNSDADVTVSEAKTVTSRAKTVTSRAQNSDIAMSTEPYKEPLKKPSGGVPPGKTSRRQQVSIPPAVEVFRDVRSRYPPKETYSLINEIVGEDPDDLDFWRNVLIQYAAQGWNRSNVTGPLDFFQRREIPGVSTRQPQQQPKPRFNGRFQ